MKDSWFGTTATSAPSGRDVQTAPVVSSASSTTQNTTRSTGGLSEQISSLPHPVRAQMAQIARIATSADEALAPIIELLVDGSPVKRAAIVSAFRSNEPLREQWERTFEILRS